MRNLVMDKNEKISTLGLLRKGFVAGIGWSFGATVGFILISTVIVGIFNALGGLPVIGSFIASIVEETQSQMIRRNPLYP